MKLITTYFKTLILTILAVFLTLSAQSAPTTPQTLNVGQPQFGFDMELSTRGLKWLTGFFDLDETEATLKIDVPNYGIFWPRVLTDDTLNDYVLNKDAFTDLPADLQRQLKEGLSIDEKPTFLSSAKPLEVNAPAALEIKKPQIILDSRRLILPQEEVTSNGLILPTTAKLDIGPDERVRSDWSILNTRWNLLPRSVKLAAVRLHHLSDRKAADVISRIPVKMKSPEHLERYLPLKSDAPEWLKRVTRTLDNRQGDIEDSPESLVPSASFEIALDGVAPTLEDVNSVLNPLFTTTYSNASLRDPLHQNRMDISFHWHISFPQVLESDTQAIAELTRRAKAFKTLMLVRILAAGPQNDSVIESNARAKFEKRDNEFHEMNRYDVSLGNRGLLRKISHNHYEIRELIGEPTAVAKEFIELMQLSTRETFDLRLRNEITQTITAQPQILEKIETSNPFILTHFKGFLPLEMLTDRLNKNIARSRFGSFEQVQSLRALQELDTQGSRCLIILNGH